MFTKEEYADYFNAIQQKEKEMSRSAESLIDDLHDEEIIKVLADIKNDEIKHDKLASELFDCI